MNNTTKGIYALVNGNKTLLIDWSFDVKNKWRKNNTVLDRLPYIDLNEKVEYVLLSQLSSETILTIAEKTQTLSDSKNLTKNSERVSELNKALYGDYSKNLQTYEKLQKIPKMLEQKVGLNEILNVCDYLPEHILLEILRKKNTEIFFNTQNKKAWMTFEKWMRSEIRKAEKIDDEEFDSFQEYEDYLKENFFISSKNLRKISRTLHQYTALRKLDQLKRSGHVLKDKERTSLKTMKRILPFG